MEHLCGIEVRSVLVVRLVDAGLPLTVQELVTSLEDAGLAVAGRSSKAVSDALRWEVRRGRVLRLDRGRYVVGSIPRTTLRDLRLRAGVVHQRGAGAWRLEAWRRRVGEAPFLMAMPSAMAASERQPAVDVTAVAATPPREDRLERR